jgi:RNA polymerase sigma-70 factor (ECF subfamily)
MGESDWLAARFEENRARLHAVAGRMLGSAREADDAVRESWRRLQRGPATDVEDVPGWLTAVLARVCLEKQRARGEPATPDESGRPDTGRRVDRASPACEALLADSVGLAMLAALETLSPVERLAFVLHDVFALPLDQIAPILDRTPDAAEALVSRARRRVHGEGCSR